MKNPTQLQGIDFVEFSTSEPQRLEKLFYDFGFSKIARHQTSAIDLFRQGQITFLLNSQPKSFGDKFQKIHGPSISSMGWRVASSQKAFEECLQRGATKAEMGDYHFKASKVIQAISGIGESLIYLTERAQGTAFNYEDYGFVSLQDPVRIPEKGFYAIDHLTNNVYKGTMVKWAQFYKDIFGFEEVRYFDIRGQKTGLTSYALRSPCGSFCIPINEASESKSQINEYLEMYHGPGIQHLAFITKDLLGSLKKLEGSQIQMLDIDANYYKDVFQRVPQVREDRQEIQKFNVLVDGDEKGYLLQIFTQNLVGPIFIELIQRENHLSFGEGNFQALFDSIERDQMKRGVFS